MILKVVMGSVREEVWVVLAGLQAGEREKRRERYIDRD